HTIEVGGRAYTAENILIATGGDPTGPHTPPHDPVISSNEGLDPPKPPRTIGLRRGGCVAREFSRLFPWVRCGIGAESSAEELRYGFGDDLRVSLAAEMRNRGIEIHTRTQVTRIEKDQREGYTVFTGIGQEISADLVMYATGRGPNTRGLGLEAIGVKANEKG